MLDTPQVALFLPEAVQSEPTTEEDLVNGVIGRHVIQANQSELCWECFPWSRTLKTGRQSRLAIKGRVREVRGTETI